MVTQHPAGIFMFACLRLYIPCHTVQHKAMSIFLRVHSVCGRGRVGTYMRMYSNGSFLGDWIFCALQLAFYVAYFILFVISIKMLTF